MKRGAYGAVLAAALASVVFAASAAAGNPHGTPPGQQKASAHVSAHASVHAMLKTHGKAHVQTSTSAGSSVNTGVKSSAITHFNTVASASSNQTKLYGNGMTAGQIALLAGQGGVMLLGPGNSQAHLVLCGTHVFDVHALKAHGGACTTGVSSTPTTIGATSSVTAPSASTSANTSASTSGVVTIKAKGHGRGGVLGATASQTGSANASGVLAATAHRSTLPFTGLALGLPIGLAFMLLVGGLGIRRAARSQTF